MADVKKPVKFYWTNLENRKDGKVKDEEIKLKVPPQSHVWRHDEDDGGSIANAPFYFRKVTGDFEVTVKVNGKGMERWLDQCGILLQEKRGIYTKCSLEYHEPPKEKGILRYYAACYVHGEEWQFERSLSPFPGQFHRPDPKFNFEMLDKGVKAIWLKMNRLEGYIEACYSLDGEEWKELKAAKFSEAETLSVGIFGACPGGDNSGFKATFENFVIEEDPEDDDDDESEDEEEESEEDESEVAEEEEEEEEYEPEPEPEEELEEEHEPEPEPEEEFEADLEPSPEPSPEPSEEEVEEEVEEKIVEQEVEEEEEEDSDDDYIARPPIDTRATLAAFDDSVSDVGVFDDSDED